MAVWEVKWLEGSRSKTKSNMYCTRRFEITPGEDGERTFKNMVLPFIEVLYLDGCLVKHIVHLTEGKML